MKLTIKIDIDLTQDELNFLRKYFVNKERTINLHFLDVGRNKPVTNQFRNTSIDLIKKDILKADSLSNVTLTNIGKKVMDMIDRDKRINDILN